MGVFLREREEEDSDSHDRRKGKGRRLMGYGGREGGTKVIAGGGSSEVAVVGDSPTVSY